MIFVTIYLFGFILSWTISWSKVIGSYGKIEDFGDFGTVIYLTFAICVLWPLVVPLYALWLLYRKVSINA